MNDFNLTVRHWIPELGDSSTANQAGIASSRGFAIKGHELTDGPVVIRIDTVADALTVMELAADFINAHQRERGWHYEASEIDSVSDGDDLTKIKIYAEGVDSKWLRLGSRARAVLRAALIADQG